MDRDNASMPMQTPKISVLEPYGYFGITLPKVAISGPSFIERQIVLFLDWSSTDWSSTKIAGLPATASKNADGAENSDSYAKKEFDQIAYVPNGSPDFDRHCGLSAFGPMPHAKVIRIEGVANAHLSSIDHSYLSI